MQARGVPVRDAERLRLRLGRLRALPRHRARADRLRLARGEAARRRVARQAARHRDRLDARLGHEQLRPVDAPQPGAAVLREQRGRDGEARHLRRDRRHARHGAAGPGARDDGVAGRRRHPRRARPTTSTCAPATTRTGTRTPASPGRTRRSSRSPGSARSRARPTSSRDEIKQLAAAVFGATPDDIELAEGQARIKANAEAALPFMAHRRDRQREQRGAAAGRRDVTLNCRYVYGRRSSCPTRSASSATSRSRTRRRSTRARSRSTRRRASTRSSTTRRWTTAATRIHPQIVEGQVHGATAQALGAATHEIFTYDEEGNLLTPNFYDYHVPHALDMPPMKTGYHRVGVAVHAARREGHGRGRRRRDPRRLRRAAERARHDAARPDRLAQLQPVRQVWETCCRSRRRRASSSSVESR